MTVVARARTLWVGWLAFHFCLIVFVSCRDSLPALASRFGWDWARSGSPKKADAQAAGGRDDWWPGPGPLRQILSTYENCAGIEAGYGYFAPSVPSSCKLVFELHYPDGRVEYELPRVGGVSAGYRLATLLDNIGSFEYPPLRRAVLKMLVRSTWEEHSDAVMIRAIFGQVNLPTASEYRAGTPVSYQLLYSYDFRLRRSTSQSIPH